MKRNSKLKGRATIEVAAFLLGLVPLLCLGQDFSADVVYLTGAAKPGAPSTASADAPHPPSRLYVSKDRLRLETQGLSGTVLLVNEGEHSAFALFPGQKAYQPLASAPSEYFWAENAENACADWQRVASQKITCEKVGREDVAGRQAVKYQSKDASGAATTAVWIDSALKFVVKWESAGASAELRNVNEAPQAADLFAVPSGYELLTPQKVKSKGFAQKSR